MGEEPTDSGNAPAPEAKKEEKKPVEVVPAKDLWRYATGTDKVLIGVSTVAAMAGGVVLPMFSVIFGELTDSLGEGGDGFTDQINDLLVWFVLLGAGSFVVSYIEVAGLIISAENQVKRIRENYVQALLRQEVGWFDSTSPGEVATRVVSDTIAVQEALGEKFGAGVRFMAQFFAGFIIGFVQGWRLTLVILALSPLLMLAGGFMTVMMQNAQSSEQAAYAGAGTIADEVIRAARTIIAFGAQEKSVVRYNEKLGDAQKEGEKKGMVQGVGLGLTMFVMFLSYGVCFFAGAQFIIADRNTEMDKYVAQGCTRLDDFACPASLAASNATAACATLCTTIIGNCISGSSGCTTGGDILAVFFAVLIGAMSLGQAAPSFAAFSKGRGSLYNIMSVIDRQPLIDITSDSGVKPTEVSGKIEFKNVKMTYPSRPDIVVLDGFNLSIEPGQTVALVGASGCGKSSTMKLVQRFYDVQEGEVLIDGHNIKDLHLKTYRQFLGLVGQEPVLFNTSVKENIRYGNPSATDADIFAAAKAANAHDFISAFPKKYDTMVGSGSVGMSGGQKQRIAIARALVKQPSILLLDEATSALDTASEREVQKALDKLMAAGKRTTLVIAHRLSTVQGADRIVVVEAGKVVEDGSHAELMAMETGAYRQFVLLQSGTDGNGAADDNEEAGEAPTMTRARSASSNADAMEPEASRARTDTRARSMSKALDGADEDDSGVVKTQDELDEMEKQDLYKVPLSRLLQKSRSEWGFGAMGVVGAAINGSTMPLWAVLFSEMLTLFFEPNSKKMEDDAWFWAGMFAIIGAAALVAHIFQFYGFTVMGERLTRRLRKETFHAMLGQEIDWFDDPLNSAGALTTRLSNDAAMVQNASTHNLGVLAQNLLTVVVGFTISFIAGWQLTLIILATFPLLVISGQLQMKAMGGFAMEGTKALEAAGSILTESIAGIQTVKAFGMEPRVLELYSESLQGPQSLGVRRGHLGGLGFGFSQAVMLWTYALAFWAGSLLIEDGTLTFENFFKVLMSVIGTAMGVGQSSSMVGDQVKAKIAVSRIFRLLDRKSEVDPYDETGKKINDVKGKLGFKNLKFAYKTRPDAPIFNGFDLDVKPGDVCALVGASGSGKSTTVSLVERFYVPQAGSVTLDGEPLETLNTAWLRSRIGFVQQEPMLFDCSVAENIRYGKEDATQEEVEAAAKAANAHKFITELSEGYDTRVGQGGGMLSGGQKQRVAIARALVRNPDIMLLDEATSALDTESERLVQAALDEMLEKSRRTTLVIAHRLSTIRNADKIVVVHDGKIAEMGTHDELLRLDDHYARLWKRQELAGAE